MLNCKVEPCVSTNILKAMPGELDIKRHSPVIVLEALFLISDNDTAIIVGLLL